MNQAKTLAYVRIVFLTISLLATLPIISQTFNQRYTNTGVQGDVTMISNSIVGNHPTNPYTGNQNNNNFDMVYIDIDNDASTFSSSSAVLNLPPCSTVIYAGLYWGTNTLKTGDTPENIRFRMPTGGYVNITADIIHSNTIFFKDVTSMITGMSNPNGTYFVANVPADVDNIPYDPIAGTGTNNNNRAAGWTLAIVYENLTEPSRYISIFDGYVEVAPNNTEQFQYSGFQTPPFGPVEGRIGISALEGDRQLTGEQLFFADQLFPPSEPDSSFSLLSDAESPSNNFFNSKITIDGVPVTTKNPNHTNTLGWDAKLLLIDESNLNSGNSMLQNNATEATVRLATTGDRIYPFLNTFSVNIIKPEIEVLTSVENLSGNQVTLGSPIQLGETVWYNLNFQNIGTDDGTNAYILNTLPINVTLDESSIEFLDENGNPLAAGLITYTYDTATRVLRFDVDDSLMIRNQGTTYNIRYQVTASNDCFDYSDACTNVLINSLEVYYTGASNPSGTQFSNPGLNGVNACGVGNPGAMELFVDTSSCQFDTTLTFCNNNLTITGDDGYNIYEWRDEDGNLLAANSKTITVTGPGVYTCTQTKVGCTVTTRVVTVLGLDVEFTPFDNLCKDSADGGVNITVTDNAATYNYEITGPGVNQSTGLISAKTHTFNGLDIGTYNVRVTNTDGCFDTFTFQVQEPTLLQASNVVLDNIMPCNGNALTGRIEVSATGGTIFTGGTNEYEYSMDGGAFQTSNIFETAVEGNHTITVRDANNCTTQTIATIDFDEEIAYNITKEDVVCLNGNNARIDINVTQNNAGNTITYSIDGVNFQSSPSFTGLTVGDYEITIRKVKGVNTCEIVEPVSIVQLVDLQFEAESAFVCETSNYSITATVAEEYRNSTRYRLNGGLENTTGIFENVPSGTHTVTVFTTVNELGSTFTCSAEPIEIIVAPYTELLVTDATATIEDENTYIIDYSGGEPDYAYAAVYLGTEEVDDPSAIVIEEDQYQLVNEFSINKTGFYMFAVRDARGCVKFVIKYLEFKDIQIPNFFTPEGDGFNDTWYPRYIDKYPNITVMIFDRYQRLITEIRGNTPDKYWDGSYKGKLLPSGDYWYIVKLNDSEDSRTFKGHFTLYRVNK